MTSPFRSLQRFWSTKDRTKYYGLLLITFVIGIALALWPIYPRHVVEFFSSPLLNKVLAEVVPKIGEALMIAAILAMVVDRAAKRQLLRDFALDVSSHIIGRHLPSEMRESLREYLSLDVIRPQWSVTYEIKELPNRTDFILLHTRTEWTLQNLSHRARPHVSSFSVERSWFPEIGETEITRWGFADPFNLQSFDRFKGDALLKPTLEGDFWVVREKHVDLPHHPHGEFRFWAECTEFYPSQFSAPFVAAVPVQNLTVTVRYPTDKFAIGLLLSFEDLEYDKQSRYPGETKWEITKPMLPGQAFFTRWSPIAAGERK